MSYHRKSLNKGRSAATFRHGASRTKAINLRGNPMRGGIRL